MHTINDQTFQTDTPSEAAEQAFTAMLTSNDPSMQHTVTGTPYTFIDVLCVGGFTIRYLAMRHADGHVSCTL